MAEIKFGKYAGYDTTEVPTEWLKWHLGDCERKARDYREELERRRIEGIVDDVELFPAPHNPSSRVAVSEARVLEPRSEEARRAVKVAEASRITGFSTTRLYHEIREGRLQAIKVGRSLVVQIEDLVEWMRKMKGREAG